MIFITPNDESALVHHKSISNTRRRSIKALCQVVVVRPASQGSPAPHRRRDKNWCRLKRLFVTHSIHPSNGGNLKNNSVGTSSCATKKSIGSSKLDWNGIDNCAQNTTLTVHGELPRKENGEFVVPSNVILELIN